MESLGTANGKLQHDSAIASGNPVKPHRPSSHQLVKFETNWWNRDIDRTRSTSYQTESLPTSEDQNTLRLQHRTALAQANQELQILDFAPLIVYTGRLHEIKRLDILIDAFRPVADRWPESRLWLVGEGPERPRLVNFIYERNLQYQVVMPGTFDDIQSVLMAADLFVLPSRCEGISIALLEAMAASLPVIASDIPGNRQVIDNGENGWLISMQHSERLSQAIVQLLQNNEAAQQMGVNARQKIEQEFLLKDRVQDHFQLFETLGLRR